MTSSKVKTSIIPKITYFVIFPLVAILAMVLCFSIVTSLNNNSIITAEAIDISDGTVLAGYLRSSSSAALVLTSNVTVPAGYAAINSNFSGSLDGNGYTISITGSSNPAWANQNLITGVLSANLSGTIKNVIINYDANHDFRLDNSLQITPNNLTAATDNSFTITAGIICGNLTETGRIENVILNTTETSALAVVGNDANGSREAVNNWLGQFQYYRYRYLGGAGGVAGGFAGRITSGTISGCTLNNQGLIFAKGHNLNVGETIWWGGNEQTAGLFTITSSMHPSRAAAGALAGEIHASATKAATLVENLHLLGDGKVFAMLRPYSNANFSPVYSSNIIGQLAASSPAPVVTIDGVLYKSANTSATSRDTGSYYAGTWLGNKSAGTLTIKNVYRRNETADQSQYSGRGVNTTYDFSGSGSAPQKTAIGFSSLATTGITNDIFVRGWGGTPADTLVNIANEIKNSTILFYGETASSAYGSADFLGFTANGNIQLQVSALGDKYISAIKFGPSGTQTTYNSYDKDTLANLKNYIFSIDKTKGNLSVYFFVADTQSSNLYMSFTGYEGITPSRTYDRSGFSFAGSAMGTPTLNNGLCWISSYKDPSGTPNSQFNTIGGNGVKSISTHYMAGTYDLALYRIIENGPGTEDDTYQKLQQDEPYGSDTPAAPKTVYIFKTSDFNMPKATITPKSVTISSGSIPFSKQYDGTTQVTGLIVNQHYLLGGLLSADISSTSISFDEGNSYFADTNGVPTSSVSVSTGDRKVILSNCAVQNPNYTLDGTPPINLELTGCSITKRIVAVVWQIYNNGGDLDIGQPFLFPYDSSIRVPELRVTNPVGEDIVNVSAKTYPNADTYTAIDCINAGTYYTEPFGLSGANSSNYALPSGTALKAYRTPFTITKKEISLDWSTSKTFVYNAEDRSLAYTCSIHNASTEVFQGDSINLVVSYRDTMNNIVPLRNVGSYSAVASKSELGGEDNYYIKSGNDVETGLTITPWSIDLRYWTGENAIVQQLLYTGTNYIGSADGLKVGIDSIGTELNSSNFNLTYKRNGVPVSEVKTVGTYIATSNIVNGTSGPSLYYSLNYSINPLKLTQELVVIPKIIGLVFGTTTFTYDATSKKDSFTVNVNPSDIISGDSVNVIKSWAVGATVTNVGQYVVNLTLTNPSYSIRTSPNDQQKTITINPCNILNNPLFVVSAISAQEYTFSARIPAPEVKYKNVVLIKDTDYSVSYSNNINAGTANVSIAGLGNFTSSVSTSFIINKKLLEISISVSPNLIYNAKSRVSDISATLIGVYSGDTAPVLAYDFYDAANSLTTPIKAGSYKVIVKFPESNYRMPLESIRTRNFNIAQKEIGITFSGYSELIFNNTNLTISVEFQENKTFCPEDSGNISLQQDHYFGPIGSQQPIMNIKNAGLYQTIVSLQGSVKDNYKITSSNIPGSIESNCYKLSFSVAKKPIKVVFSNNTVDFNNTDQKITYEAVTGYAPLGGDTLNSICQVLYSKGDYTSYNGAKNAGVYSVAISAFNANYIVIETSPAQPLFTINKKLIKMYLTINGQPLLENEEFIYGGQSQNIGSQIGFAYRSGFTPVTGDNVASQESFVTKSLYRGDTKIEGAYNVRNDYRVSIELGTIAVNYSLVRKIVIPEEDSVLERNFSIKPRPIRIVTIQSDVEYTGFTSSSIQSGLANGDGYIADLSTPSGIVSGESVSLQTYVYAFTPKDNNGQSLPEITYLASERLTFKDRGIYKTRCIISGQSNYYIYTSETISNEHSFEVFPKEITFVPKNISKTFGDGDPTALFSISVPGVGDDGDILATLTRNSGENVGQYSYLGISYLGSSNYSVQLNLNARDNEGELYKFTILMREYQLTPRSFTIEWNPIEPTIELKETIEIVTVTQDTIYIEIEYTRTGSAIPDAGVYDFSKLTESPDNPNVNVVFAGANGDSAKGKFIVLGRPVEIKIKDFEKTYDEPDPSFYNPQNFSVTITDLPQSIQNLYNSDPENFNWSQLIYVNRAPGEVYMPNGYNLTYSFIGEEAKNYRPVILDFLSGEPKLSTKLMINRYEVSIGELQLLVTIEKDYDGNNRINKNLVTLTTASRNELYAKNPKLFQKGFAPSARFASSDLGEGDSDAAINKRVYVSFSVFEEYQRNYILPQEFLYSTEGIIKKIIIPVTMDVDNSTGKSSLTYGDSPSVIAKYSNIERLLQQGNPNYKIYINYGKLGNSYTYFVGSDSPSTLGVDIRAVYSDQSEVSSTNIRDVGYHSIYLTNATTNNYIIKTDYVAEEINSPSSSTSIEYSKKLISIVSSGKAFKKPVDNTYDATLDLSHYNIVGILNKDQGTVSITYETALQSILVGSTQVSMTSIELTGSRSFNYLLGNNSLTIPANILSLASVSLPLPIEREFNNQQYYISPIINSYLSGATLKINGQVLYEGTTGMQLDGEGTTINIQIYYTGLSGGYYPKTMTPPKDAGLYSVTCNITNDGEGYVKVDAATTTLKINKVTPTITLSGRFRQEYGSFTPLLASVIAPGLSESLDVDYSFENNGVLPQFPKAGTHSVSVIYTPPKTYPINYNPVNKTGELRIIPKQIQVSITGFQQGFVYNGQNRLQEVQIEFSGIVEGDNCIPVVSVNGQNEILEIINAGTYLIDVSPSNDSYVIIGTSSVYLTINKAQLKVKAIVGQTNAGQFPDYSIEYEGFQGEDSPDKLLSQPGLNLLGNSVGTNTAMPKGGSDPNYEYEFIPSTYEVVYTSPNDSSSNFTMYYIIAGILGGIIIIFLVSFFGKKLMLKNMYKSMKKKA